MFGHLPTEIIVKILVRLPLKSLPRFTLVCKLWYTTIKNPNFITALWSQWFSRSDASQFLFLFDSFSRKYVLLHDDNKFKENPIELTLPITGLGPSPGFIGYCNGLIFFQGLCDGKICIWNPCMRKSVCFTFPDKLGYHHTFGFGFISKENIYKVVRILNFVSHREVPLEVEVYEQGKGKWREIGCAPPRYTTMQIKPSQVFLHGAVHWLAYDLTVKEESRNSIVAFEMVDEEFKDIALPPIPAGHLPGLLSFSFLKDSLAVLCGSNTGECSLWVMREYGVFGSWTNLYNVLVFTISKSNNIKDKD